MNPSTVVVVPEYMLPEASETATEDCDVGDMDSDDDSFDNDANVCWEHFCLVAQGPSVALTISTPVLLGWQNPLLLLFSCFLVFCRLDSL